MNPSKCMVSPQTLAVKAMSELCKGWATRYCTLQTDVPYGVMAWLAVLKIVDGELHSLYKCWSHKQEVSGLHSMRCRHSHHMVMFGPTTLIK